MQTQAHASSAHFTDRNTVQNPGHAHLRDKETGLNADPTLLGTLCDGHELEQFHLLADRKRGFQGDTDLRLHADRTMK